MIDSLIYMILGFGVIILYFFTYKPTKNKHFNRMDLTIFVSTLIFASIVIIYNFVYSLLNY